MDGGDYSDILYEVKNRTATITFNRPHRMNAFTRNTYYEVTDAIRRAGWDREIGAIVLTGAGDRAFAIGGDKQEKKADRVDSGIGILGNGVEEMQTVIRDVPKPVIAKVRGYAVGSGNVIVTLCDLAIASETASFGQVGSKGGLGRSPGSARPISRARSARKAPASSGTCAGAIRLAKPWRWG